MALSFRITNKGLFTPDLIQNIILVAHNRNIPYFVDPKQKNFWAYSGAAIFKPNKSEIYAAFKHPAESTLKEVLCSSAQKLECDLLMCTLAEEGIAFVHDGEFKQVPTQKVDVLDVSGAGDTALSIMVLAYLLGYDPSAISLLANLGGKIVCMKSGVSTLTIQELKKALDSVRRDIDI